MFYSNNNGMTIKTDSIVKETAKAILYRVTVIDFNLNSHEVNIWVAKAGISSTHEINGVTLITVKPWQKRKLLEHISANEFDSVSNWTKAIKRSIA